MQDYDGAQIIKVTPDAQRAKALLFLAEMRLKDISQKSLEFAPLIAEGYYEAILELITAIMRFDGHSTLSHEQAIAYLAKFYKEVPYSEIHLIDQLRRARHDITYRGILVQPGYLERNGKDILAVIEKLMAILSEKLMKSENL